MATTPKRDQGQPVADRQYQVDSSTLRMIFVGLIVGGIGAVVLLLVLASAGPRGNYVTPDRSAYQQNLLDAAAQLESYQDEGEGRYSIPVQRAMEVMAAQGLSSVQASLNGQAPSFSQPQLAQAQPNTRGNSETGTLILSSGQRSATAPASSGHSASTDPHADAYADAHTGHAPRTTAIYRASHSATVHSLASGATPFEQYLERGAFTRPVFEVADAHHGAASDHSTHTTQDTSEHRLPEHEQPAQAQEVHAPAVTHHQDDVQTEMPPAPYDTPLAEEALEPTPSHQAEPPANDYAQPPATEVATEPVHITPSQEVVESEQAAATDSELEASALVVDTTEVETTEPVAAQEEPNDAVAPVTAVQPTEEQPTEEQLTGAQAETSEPVEVEETEAETPTETMAMLVNEAGYSNCVACHQATGQGLPGAFPPLVGHAPELYAAERNYLPKLMVNGLQGQIEVQGMAYNSVMAVAWPQLSDEDLAGVLNYILTAWGNEDLLPADFSPYTAADIASARESNLGMAGMHEYRQEIITE